MSNTRTNANKTKKIVGIVLNVLLWIFLVFAFLMMVFAFASISNDYGVPVLGKKVILTVASDSMKPTFEEGDLLVGTVLTEDEKLKLQSGDIITFFTDLDGDGVKELNTHRITYTDGIEFRTKGDNNQINDSYSIYGKDIVCKWSESDTKIKGIGKFFAFLQSRIGFLCVIVIPLAVFFIYEIIRFVMTIIKLKDGGKKKITAEDEAAIRQKAIEEYLKLHQAEPAKEEPTEAPAEVPEDKPED